MSANHTPTPWEAQDFCDGDEGFAIIGSNLGGLVAYAMMQPADIDNQDTSRAEANAEFIVAACNAYASNQSEIARLREALTPSADTKAAYIDEFSFDVVVGDDDGEDIHETYTVPWTTIKEIMAAILAKAEGRS